MGNIWGHMCLCVYMYVWSMYSYLSNPMLEMAVNDLQNHLIFRHQYYQWKIRLLLHRNNFPILDFTYLNLTRRILGKKKSALGFFYSCSFSRQSSAEWCLQKNSDEGYSQNINVCFPSLLWHVEYMCCKAQM